MSICMLVAFDTSFFRLLTGILFEDLSVCIRIAWSFILYVS